MQLGLGVALGEADLAAGRFQLLQAISRPTDIEGEVLIARGSVVGEERRVRREDAVPPAERDQFLDQFLVLALQVDLVDQLADPAHGPQLLDKGIRLIAGTGDQLGREVKRPLLAADRAGDRHLGIAGLLVSPYQHQLLPGEQIDGAFGIQPIDRRAVFDLGPLHVEMNRHVHQHGRVDLVV